MSSGALGCAGTYVSAAARYALRDLVQHGFRPKAVDTYSDIDAVNLR